MIIKDDLIELIKPYIKDYECYLTGGYIREYLLNKNSSDRDITVKTDNLENLAKKIADNLNASFVILDKENEIYRVVFNKEEYIDFAKLENNSLEDDTDRRDFTINSIMYDINRDKLIDKNFGIEDLKNKIIKTKNLKNLSDDPLRMLRAIRFKSETGFRVDDDIIKFIKENAKLLNNIAGERIHQELIKVFEGEFLADSLVLADETGILEVIFPFFSEIKKIPKNSHHHLNLFYHLVETTKNIRINKPLLKLSAFLHDLAKPDCWTIDKETGRHRFIGHDEEGSKKVVPYLKKLKFSNKEIEYISKMIKYHIYPSALMSDVNVSEKAMIRFVKKIGDDTVDLIELSRADRLSARGEAVTDEMIKTNLENLDKLSDFYNKIQPKLKSLPKLIDGNEIMKLLNIKPSKKLKEIINEINEKQIEGIITTKEDAVNFVLSLKN